MAARRRRGERRLMNPYALGYFYRRRLRVHGMQELLAGLGIAIAVALVVSTLIAEGSIAGSTERVVRTVVGPASLQLRSRTSQGFDERLLGRVEALKGVAQAAPLLEQTATVKDDSGRPHTLVVAGTDTSLAILDGLAHSLPLSAFSPGGIGLSRATAAVLGRQRIGGAVDFAVRGQTYRLRLAAVLGPEAAKGLSDALAAVMPLSELQRLARLPRRITRVLVKVVPGRQREVEVGLRELAAGRLTIAPARQDIAILHEALRPSDQASAFFAGVAGILGFLFAFTAILLTVPERRRAIADLRLVGTRRRTITQMVIFQALCLGIAASLVGVLAGYALSRWALHQSTTYLSEAFTLGTSTVVTLKSLALVFVGGVLATCLASALPLLDLRRKRRVDAVYAETGVPGNELSTRTQLVLALSAGLLVALQVALVAQWPSLALPASVLVAIATVLVVPLVLTGIMAAARALSERVQGLSILPIALASLRATTLRSLVLAATGAAAIFGSVALGGARADLLRGIHRYAHNYTAAEQVWIGSPNNNQATVDFPPGDLAQRVSRVNGVAGVSAFQGGFLDVGNRRVWVIAWPASSRFNLLQGQVLSGSVPAAQRRLREGGWVTVSKQLVPTHGATLQLPVPTGHTQMRIAASTTNFGWPPGAILMNTTDYTRAWGTNAITGLGVTLRAGADAEAVARAIKHALGRSRGLEVLTARARESRIDASASEGLGRLGEISDALIIAAILAMAATLGSSIWQRRASLAGLRLSGVKPARLRRVLLVECALMLAAGCLTGAVAGIYGELVIDKYLRDVTGFPVASAKIGGQPLEVLALVLVGALAIVMVPGWLASRVPANLALEGER